MIENYDKYTWKETGTITRSDKLRMLKDLKKEDLFISKYLVVPIFYRDKQTTGGKISIPEVNYVYNKLIQYTQNLDDDIFTLVDVDFSEYRKRVDNKAVKKNCTIPYWMSVEADKAGVNYSRVLQDALAGILGVKKLTN